MKIHPNSLKNLTYRTPKGVGIFTGKKHSQESRLKMSKAKAGVYFDSNNPNWKGNNISYVGIHAWLYRKFGKATKCENKKCFYPRTNAHGDILLKPKSFQWANKSGEYLRDIGDWMQLCTSCHKRHDAGLTIVII